MSISGLKFLRAKRDPAPKNAPVEAPAAPKNDAPAGLLVWATAPRNRRLVIAYREGDDPMDPTKLVSVIVRENGHFLRGMRLPGPDRQLVVAREGVFTLQGSCPRWRGRW
jgi:hypothetical protein